MSYSNTVTKEDLKNVLNEVLPQASGEYMFVGSATGTNSVTLPNNWIDIVVVGKFGLNGVYGFTEFFIRKQLETYENPNRFFGGNCTNSGNDYHGYWLQLSTSSVALGGWNWAGTNYASASTIYVWARTGNAGQSTADYIVEQGTSGIWTYRKWNSGIAECWGINSASVTCSVISSPWIRGSMNNINFPSSLFNDTPLVMLTGFNAEWVSLASHSKDAISTIYIYTVATGTSTRSVRIHAIGTWK